MTGRRCLHSDSALNARKNIPSKTQIWKKVQRNCTYTFTKLWNNVQFLCCYHLISLPRVHTCWPDLPLVAERAFHCRRTSSSSLLPDPESPPPLSNSASLEQQQPPLHKSAFLQLPTARNSWPRRVQIWRGWQKEKLGVAWCQLSVQPEHSFILSLYFLLSCPTFFPSSGNGNYSSYISANWRSTWQPDGQMANSSKQDRERLSEAEEKKKKKHVWGRTERTVNTEKKRLLWWERRSWRCYSSAVIYHQLCCRLVNRKCQGQSEESTCKGLRQRQSCVLHPPATARASSPNLTWNTATGFSAAT